MSLVPRAVQRPAPSNTSTSIRPTSSTSKASSDTEHNGSGDTGNTAKQEGNKLSNEDFRNMLLKK